MLELPHCLVGWATQARAEVQRSGFLFWLADASVVEVEAAIFVLQEVFMFPVVLWDSSSVQLDGHLLGA